MGEMRVPSCIIEHIIAAGYVDAQTFAYAFTDSQALEEWLQDVLVAQGLARAAGVDPARWATSPVAGSVRRLWNDSCSSPAGGSSSALVPAGASDWQEPVPPKLSAERAAEMKDAFERCYPGEILDESCIPGMRYWSSVYDMISRRSLKWLPWTQILSVSQESKIMEQRGRRASSALQDLGALLRLSTDEPPSLTDGELRGMGPWKVEQLFRIRRVTFALCQACHLGQHKIFDNKVMDLYTKDHGDSSLRGPSLSELVAADKSVFQSMYKLVNEGAWTLDQVLQDFTVSRADLTMALQPRPRPAPPRIDYVQQSSRGVPKGADRRTPKGNPKGGGRHAQRRRQRQRRRQARQAFRPCQAHLCHLGRVGSLLAHRVHGREQAHDLLQALQHFGVHHGQGALPLRAQVPGPEGRREPLLGVPPRRRPQRLFPSRRVGTSPPGLFAGARGRRGAWRPFGRQAVWRPFQYRPAGPVLPLAACHFDRPPRVHQF